jgi:hypothetical protein
MGLFNETSTSTVLKNTGLQKYSGTAGKWKYLVLAPKGSEIATKTLALTKATWVDNQNAAIGSRWFIMPLIFNGTPEQEEVVKETSDFGYESIVRDGKLVYKIDFEEIHIHNVNSLFSMNNGSFDAYVITDKSFIIGFSADGIKFRPIQLDYARVLPRTQNTGSTQQRVQFELRTTDIRQLNDLCVELDCVNDADAPAAWYPDLELPVAQPKDLIITLTSVAATSFALNLKGYDGVAYAAAVKEDLYLRKTSATGTAIPITSLTYVSEGNYTGVIGSQTAGTFYASLYDQPTATTQGVETPVVSSYVMT